MTSLESYIAELIQLDLGLEKFIDNQIMANKGQILQTIKLRLYNKGIDGNENALFPYSKSTIASKKNKGEVSSHTTLRDTGAFFRGMFIESYKGNIFISSSDSKTGILVARYGEPIFDLTKYEQEQIVQTIIEPKLDAYLNSIDTQISLDL